MEASVGRSDVYPIGDPQVAPSLPPTGTDSLFRQLPVGSGEAFVSKARLSERFEVPGAMVSCERRTLLGWRLIGPPCQVRDMSMMGLGFLHVGNALKTESAVRLTIHLPVHLPITLKGRVARLSKLPESIMTVCAVHFTDYSAEVWTVLCEVHSRYSESGRSAGARQEQRKELAAAALKRRKIG